MPRNCFLDHYWGCIVQLLANNNYFSLVTTNNPRSRCESKPGPVFLSFLNWQVSPPQLPSSLAYKNSLLSFKVNIHLVGPLLRLVFRSDRVGVGGGVVIRSIKIYDLVKTAFWFSYSKNSVHDSVLYDQVKTGLSESQAEVDELNQSQSQGMCIVIGLSFHFCFQLWQSGFH